MQEVSALWSLSRRKPVRRLQGNLVEQKRNHTPKNDRWLLLAVRVSFPSIKAKCHSRPLPYSLKKWWVSYLRSNSIRYYNNSRLIWKIQGNLLFHHRSRHDERARPKEPNKASSLQKKSWCRAVGRKSLKLLHRFTARFLPSSGRWEVGEDGEVWSTKDLVRCRVDLLQSARAKNGAAVKFNQVKRSC